MVLVSNSHHYLIFLSNTKQVWVSLGPFDNMRAFPKVH